jgi:hypothetical protein
MCLLMEPALLVEERHGRPPTRRPLSDSANKKNDIIMTAPPDTFRQNQAIARVIMGESAPIPSNEAERLKELAKFCPAGSDSDEVFDKIVAMTSAYFNAPITLISIVDEHRQ